MAIVFHASEFISLPVSEQKISIKHYLRQPQRLIYALREKSQIEFLRESNLPEDHYAFRLKMQPLNFLQIVIQPIVDIEVWTESDWTVSVRSLRTEIYGNEYINQRFSLKLVGQLKSQIDRLNKIKLIGEVNLQVNVDMPAIFQLTPPLVLEIAGNSLLKSVLMSMKQRLMHRLIDDYINWAKASDACASTTISMIKPA